MKFIDILLLAFILINGAVEEVQLISIHKKRPTFADFVAQEEGREDIDFMNASEFEALRYVSDVGISSLNTRDRLVREVSNWFNELPDRGLSDFKQNYQDFIEEPCSYLRETVASSQEEDDQTQNLVKSMLDSCEILLDRKVRSSIRKNIFESNCGDLCMKDPFKLKRMLRRFKTHLCPLRR